MNEKVTVQLGGDQAEAPRGLQASGPLLTLPPSGVDLAAGLGLGPAESVLSPWDVINLLQLILGWYDFPHPEHTVLSSCKWAYKVQSLAF